MTYHDAETLQTFVRYVASRVRMTSRGMDFQADPVDFWHRVDRATAAARRLVEAHPRPETGSDHTTA